MVTTICNGRSDLEYQQSGWTPAAYITGAKLREGLCSSGKVFHRRRQGILALVLSRQHLHLHERHSRKNIFPSLRVFFCFFLEKQGSCDVELRETKRHPQNYKSTLLAAAAATWRSSEAQCSWHSICHLYTTVPVFWFSVPCSTNRQPEFISLLDTFANTDFFFLKRDSAPFSSRWVAHIPRPKNAVSKRLNNWLPSLLSDWASYDLQRQAE